ncbi:MAG TPA: vitamin K epoxide reductase family protein, partial [Spirochaetota bacterium]|nr:vitamin K epoxide reductase family protein [Spirochaetota bacterium]
MHIKKFFLSMLITCGIGVIISAYLLYIHYFPLIPDAALYSLCTAGSTFDCNAVNTSAYAMLFGMPLAAWGMAFYLFFIAVILIYTIKTKHVILEFGMLWLAIFAVLLSVVLGYISFVKIQKFCSFCMALWLCNVALLTLVLIYIALLYKGLIRGINTIHDFTVATLFADSKLRGTIVVLVIAAVVSLLVAWGIDGTLQLAYNQKQKQREAIILQEFKKEYTMFERVAIPVDGTIPVIGK